VNERPLSELKPIDVLDKVTTIMDISEVVQKEEARVKVEEYLDVVAKNVDSFNIEFEVNFSKSLRHSFRCPRH